MFDDQSVRDEAPSRVLGRRAMPRKGVKCPLDWTLVDENIENVERLRLDLETQRELGCLVGEHVFLEYPWAYVNRDIVARLAKRPESPLAAFEEKIGVYEGDTFLVGYASSQLASHDFVICLTEEAKRAILKRNKIIARSIWKRVLDKILKTPKPWKFLGSESEVDETFATGIRELFEVEITLPGDTLGSTRTLDDRDSGSCRDSYVELVNKNEGFDNIDRKCICRSAQTHLQPGQAFVQTYPGHPKNAWTQYVYEDTLDEEVEPEEDLEEGVTEESERTDEERSKGKSDVQDKESDDEPKEKTPLELFLEERSHEMIDVVKYNAAVNVYVDDIEDLSRHRSPIRNLAEAPAFREHLSFADLKLTGNKAVFDVSLPSMVPDRAAISYVSVPAQTPSASEIVSQHEIQSKVLVWKFDEPLRPLLRLQYHREIYCVSFCPFDDNLVIGGCSTGHVVIWDTKSDPSNDPNGARSFTDQEEYAPAIVVSDNSRSHRLPVRRIQWMPAKYKIEPSGKLTKSTVVTGPQFLTASEDGTVAVWNLDDKVSGDAFQPILRFEIPVANGESLNLTCLLLSSTSVLQESDENQRNAHELSSKETDYMKSFWIGCDEGLIRCTWDEQMYDEGTADAIECKILARSCVHDGPVTEIMRSPHLQEVLLTIGGRVFAIWKDDCLDSPLFWRRTDRRYTASCWANEPGVFLLAGVRGELDLWDVKNESSEPVFSQTVSSRPITCLLSLDCSAVGGQFQGIGVGDDGGFFRVLREPETLCSDTTIERMDWFEEYVWREVRRKKVFSSWQNDFLANDPAVIAKRSARRDAERKRELVEARERLRREQDERLRLKAEKRSRSAPRPKHVAWKSKEHDRMKAVLLSKRNLVPSELEAKRLPLVVKETEREEKLKKARERSNRREMYLSDTLSRELPELLESKSEKLISEEPTSVFRTSDYLRKFEEIRIKAREMVENYPKNSNLQYDRMKDKRRARVVQNSTFRKS
ncbi:dynein axonemal intermediate chain 3-like [Hylaeus anthracinus]|uniref:dynein axonemal intermediate chain 3-like n=1 Tax=Hylaeus anthracinus TaxID=313031 RepID=UPI0023B97B14|nr:dynein axonemal intermediate chain 3-like [Hylaeus anthracinus]